MEDNTENKVLADEKPVQEKLIISSSPHLLKGEKTNNIMWLVTACLMPSAIYGVYAFGLQAFLILLTSVLFGLITEAVCLKLRKKRVSLDDGSAFLTGLLVGLNMPPNVPLYIPIISSIFAIGLVKHAFGGLGQNWANPAIAARVFALFAWTKKMTTWSAPFLPDSITTATPLGAVKSALMDTSTSFAAPHSGGYFASIFTGPLELFNKAVGENLSYLDLFFGFKGGCIGEISIFLLLMGSLYLIYKKIITLDIPLTYIGTVVIIAWVFDGLNFGKGFFQGDFLFHVLTGGLILGAFFMATDMVTTPLTVKGRIIFGIGCGVLTMLIRMLGGLPEGVSLSILFMNMVTPVLDRFIKIKPMGYLNEKVKTA